MNLLRTSENLGTISASLSRFTLINETLGAIWLILTKSVDKLNFCKFSSFSLLCRLFFCFVKRRYEFRQKATFICFHLFCKWSSTHITFCYIPPTFCATAPTFCSIWSTSSTKRGSHFARPHSHYARFAFILWRVCAGAKISQISNEWNILFERKIRLIMCNYNYMWGSSEIQKFACRFGSSS